MPEAVNIANRPFWARISAVFWRIEIALGLGFATGSRGFAASGEHGLAVAMLVCGLLLAATSLRSWRIEGAAIEMCEDGFIDRRIAAQLIPWAAMTWKVVFNSRAYSLQFDVRPPQREALEVYWEQRVMGRFNRMFKYPELTIVTPGTGRTAHQQADLMARF